MSDPRQEAENIYPAAIAAAVFAFSCSQPMWGFLAFLWAIPVFIWMLFQLAHALSHAEARKNCALRVGIWVFAFALVFGFHGFQDRSRHQAADGFVAKIHDYQARHKTCPPTLEAIGESRKSLENGLGRRSGYRCEEGRARLFYTIPSSGFDLYRYDFEQKTWRLLPD
jgi:hypothetical protein